MYKLLKSLMVVTILSTPLTVVISCGNKNQDPENTLKTTFTNNPLHWLTAKTMQQSDFKILSNTNSAPLGTDEFGREYGDLFEVQTQIILKMILILDYMMKAIKLEHIN
ncbi:hypothetical protein [Spiroplasma turonicum]|uniref:Oligopeptide-binding protein SarA n=1 Tax=Spiroplasma turonicum TaxID=216946 RepID=A0A0K1P726_9MOLU|nr:hypothetical protein [Spiroplasma turonicum]AKU79692.1 oligopeptide-binding protein SarA [Spiroplasma turonicum]